MAHRHGSWAERISSGGVDRVLQTSHSLDDAAFRLGCSVPALKRAWGRYGTGNIHDRIGDESSHTDSSDAFDADTLDEMLSGIKLPGENTTQRGPEQTLIIEPLDGERWLIPGDIHFPIADMHAISLMQRCADDFEITRVIQQGDTYDCYGISRHNKQARRINQGQLSLAGEREAGREFQEWAAEIARRNALPGIFMPGNHEDRLEAIQDLNPGLDGTLSVRRVFDIPDEIEVLPHRSRIRAGSLVVEHGHQLPGSLSSYGCKRVLTRFPDQTTIYGHTHRIGEWAHTTYDLDGQPRTRKAVTIGHMSNWRMHSAYAPRPNWQQGFLLVEFWRSAKNDIRFTLYPIEIHSGEFMFNGVHYR